MFVLVSYFILAISIAVCLVKAHVNPTFGYDYLVLAETEGDDRCRNLHIFARDRGHFDNLYTSRIAKYIKNVSL